MQTRTIAMAVLPCMVDRVWSWVECGQLSNGREIWVEEGELTGVGDERWEAVSRPARTVVS